MDKRIQRRHCIGLSERGGRQVGGEDCMLRYDTVQQTHCTYGTSQVTHAASLQAGRQTTLATS
eukprot:359211-Chlamydomonas_euryale.AAC.8